MEHHVGTCSLCGGAVYGVRGAWYSILPPPPDHCTACGAVRADHVIEMWRPPTPQAYNPPWRIITTDRTTPMTGTPGYDTWQYPTTGSTASPHQESTP
jgi:hypothetical protein